MPQLGQSGSDTVTHIVSISMIGLVLLGFPVILAAFNAVPNNVDTPTHAAVVIAICQVEAIGVIMMAYYSATYQKTPTGQITVSTVAPDGTTTNKVSTVSSLIVIGPDGKEIPIPPGSTLKT
jgi:hypothetical protein